MAINAAAAHAGRRSEALTLVAAVLALGLGIWLRLVALGHDGFWLDEVFSASFADLSFPGTLIAVLVLDVHPPLYYLQLNAWGRLGHGDVWLLLNSVAWSTVAMLGVYFGTRRQYGASAGLLALLLCAVLGGEIFFAHELRMYPMASGLAVLSWIAADQLASDYRFVRALPLIIVLALLGAIHSASVIAASAALLYVFPSGTWAQIRKALQTWISISAVVVCSYLPWLVSAGSRDSIGHAGSPSLPALMQTVGGWLIGYGDLPLPAWLRIAAASLVALGLLVAALSGARLARLVLCFLVWPLLFGAILCVLVQPIWLDRTFAFCAPFVAVTIAVAVSQLWELAARGGHRVAAISILCTFGGLIAASAMLAYLQTTRTHKPDQFRELAHFIETNAAAGELIYVPTAVDFWGVNRYLIGPDWGSILKIHDIAVMHLSRRWRLLYASIGQAKLERLGVMPETRHLDRYRIPVYSGMSPLPELPAVTGEWLVAMEGEHLESPEDWRLCTSRYPSPMRFGRLELYHWRCRMSSRQ
jgi:hypothetical protein